MKMSSIMQKEKITAIPLCSIKSQAVLDVGNIRVEF